MKYGKETFCELEYVNENGFIFQGIHYDIQVVSCCDWKAAACIEGNCCVIYQVEFLVINI